MKEEDESTDIGALWNEALDQYRKETRHNREVADQVTRHMKMDVSLVLQEQNRQLERFIDWRHGGGFVDKLRSAVSKNSDIITSLATQLGNAAAGVGTIPNSIWGSYNSISLLNLL
jgi:hypothetical protein